MEQGSGPMVAAGGTDKRGVSGGALGLGGAPGWAQGRRPGREVQTASNIQSPSGHFVMSVSRWTEQQLKEGLVCGLGMVGGMLSSLGVSSSTFVIC